MIAVIFELTLEPAEGDRYFDLAASLRNELDGADGFISIERFKSLAEKNKFVSLSFWRDRDAVDRLYAFLKDRSDIVFVHGPQEEPWAPGYYSILFEDPDGIRIEFNHVPGVGLLEAGREIGGAEIFD